MNSVRAIVEPANPGHGRRVPTAQFAILVVVSALLAVGGVAFLAVGLVATAVVDANYANLKAEHATLEAEWQSRGAAARMLIKTWEADGWTYSGSDHVFFRWAETDGSDCADYQCLAVDISTTDIPCPNHVSIEVSILSEGTTIGTVTERTAGLSAFSDARVWVENRTGQHSDAFTIAESAVKCR